MPEITTNASILKAARSATEIKLKFQGKSYVLHPAKGVRIPKPGGGHDFAEPVPRTAQVFAIAKLDRFDTVDYSENDDGKSQKRSYVMIGRYDAVIAKGDTFSDSEANYIVDTLDQTSGFNTVAGVTGWLKQV